MKRDALDMTANQRMARPSQALSGWIIGLAFVGLSLDLTAPAVSRATNGLNLIGSGGISSALAGADTAVATDFSAMNTNPAGMVQIRGEHAGLSIGIIQPQQNFSNSQNDLDAKNDPFVIPNAGYVRHIPDTRVTVGVGFFTVGGTAADYRGLQTQFGTTDKTSSQIRHYKLTPSIAYQVTDKLSIGVTLGLSYSDLSLAVLPNTALAGVIAGFESTGTCDRANGLGMPATCAYALGFAPRYGLMYKFNEMVTFGLAYNSSIHLPFSNGQITRNQAGIGKVTYDADVNGFKWADDLSAGIALRPQKGLLIGLKFQWINWDAAMNNVVVNLKNGNNSTMPTDRIILQYKWRDQYVVAVGATYDATEQLTVHAGYNVGNNPVPVNTLDPTSANITTNHVAGGGTYKFTDELKLQGVVTYAPTNSVKFNSTVYGNNSNLNVGGAEYQFTLTYSPK